MHLDELERQYRGVTLPKLVENQSKSMKESVLLEAIQGTYQSFPVGTAPLFDAYTLAYLEKWFEPSISTADLGRIFRTKACDISERAASKGIFLSNEQVFDVFNLMVMRLTAIAHSQSDLSKQFGIKKGWFS